MRERQRVVIIGSGLGGLSCGVILAKNGYDVTILEQGVQIGGCLQCFRRGGAIFETGMHFIGSAAEGQTLHKLMRYLELDKNVKLSPLDAEAYNVVAIGGKRYEFPNGRRAFVEKMSSYFPQQRENLERYFDVVEKVGKASTLDTLQHIDAAISLDPQYLLHSVDEVLSKLISDPLLAEVLAGDMPLYAAEKGKTPFTRHAFIADFYNQSAFRIVGGSDAIAKSLQQTFCRLGGEIRTRSKVVEILCNDEKACGVRLEGGEEILCDFVISSAHPKRTLEMLGSKLLRPAFRARIAAIPETVGVFSLYLKFKKQALPYMNSNFFGYRSKSVWGTENYTPEEWPKSYLYMHTCKEQQQQYAESGVVMAYMQKHELSPWLHTTVGRRGEDYEDFKRRKAEKLLDALEEEFPGLREKIEAYHTATPLTYRDYTGTEDGGLYGMAQDVAKMVDYKVSPRLRIPNVLLTGQNVNAHGMLGVLVGTLMTCSELLTSEHIVQQIMKTDE